MESDDFSIDFNINYSEIKDNNSEKNEEEEGDANKDIIEFKIILIGNVSVGKTSIFNKFTTGDFSKIYKSTIAAEFKSKLLKVNKNLWAKLVIWDTCGSENFRAVTRQYYRGADGAIVIFDLTDQSSFNDLKKWIKDIKNYGEKDIQIIIVGNKLDLFNQRKVTQSQANNFCNENKYKYIEASAKDGTNLLKIFEELTFDLTNKNLQKIKNEENKKSQIKNLEIMVKEETQKEKKGCC
jgi:Ras-related protein Rab-11A